MDILSKYLYKSESWFIDKSENLYKQKKITSLDKILLTDDIYSDFKKGKKAKESDLISVFKTKNKIECIKLMHF